ncbi:uncharacterized protein [Physcomitrium patens]|uniref:uncharacterized protein n=1 Tax=Physcomitrium patens TaxID=3218 RepID=UPI000D162C11|nr:uncharacterized protein LOC112291840 [Physcomitrium patens]|eukprot:XP_024395520.1 uncharacterized protein LOC112291840 [Physcomitrella patens]
MFTSSNPPIELTPSANQNPSPCRTRTRTETTRVERGDRGVVGPFPAFARDAPLPAGSQGPGWVLADTAGNYDDEGSGVDRFLRLAVGTCTCTTAFITIQLRRVALHKSSPRAVITPRAHVTDREMATSGNAPAAGPKPEKPAEDKNRSKDELIAKAAGAVVAGGIVWSLFKSVTRKEKSQQENEGSLTKEVGHKTKDVAQSAEHKGISAMHTSEAAGGALSHFGNKKLDNCKTIQVHKGDTLWGISRKYNVTVEALMATNGIKDGDNIAAGESIMVPK